MGMLLALAPMKDVTDLPYLRVLSSLGTLPDYFITEYFRVNPHHVKLEQGILRAIDENPTDLPVYAQLVGADAPSLARDAKGLLANHPVAGIDLNMGCPAPLVCRKNAGGGMLRTLANMDSTLGAMRDALPAGTFTVKCRIGWEDPWEFTRILPIIARHSPDRLVVHGRTVKEGYRTPIHFDAIRLAVETMSCPVIANGNVVDAPSASYCLSASSAAGIMVGRAVIRNPWIFSHLRDMQAGKQVQPVPLRSILRYAELLLEETAAFFLPYDERKHVQRLKRYMIYVACGLPFEFGHDIRRVRTAHDYLHICRTHFDRDGFIPAMPPDDGHLFTGVRYE